MANQLRQKSESLMRNIHNQGILCHRRQQYPCCFRNRSHKECERSRSVCYDSLFSYLHFQSSEGLNECEQVLNVHGSVTSLCVDRINGAIISGVLDTIRFVNYVSK